MADSNERTPNRQLAWARLQRGWSREALADRVRREMIRCNEINTGLTADTIRRWEMGLRRTDPRYREHLVSVFGKPASELGLLTPEELAIRPVDDVAREVTRLIDLVAVGLAERGIDRGTFLRGLLGGAVTPSLVPALLSSGGDTIERLLRVLGGTSSVDATSVDAYVGGVELNRTLYWTTSPRAMFSAARTHAELGVHLVRSTKDSALRRRLAAATSEACLLAGRLAFFDLQQHDLSQVFFDVALDASEEAGNHELALAVCAHMAFLPGFTGDFARARSRLREAAGHAAQGAGPRTRSWLHCVNAEIEARAGETRACLHRIGLAEGSLACDGEDPCWLDFFDGNRLDGFAGYCLLMAGRHRDAEVRLKRAVKQLRPNGAKQAAVLYADIAAATASADEDQALAYLHQAIDQLESGWYAVGYERVHDHRGCLRTDARRAEVTDRLTDLVAGVAT